jgi:hypothetical protein
VHRSQETIDYSWFAIRIFLRKIQTEKMDGTSYGEGTGCFHAFCRSTALWARGILFLTGKLSGHN